MDRIVVTSRGRNITEKDIGAIKEIIDRYYSKGRKYISQKLAIYWNWYQPNGNLKDMACREILLKLDRLNLIKLPPPKIVPNSKKDRSYVQLDLEIPKVCFEGNLSRFEKITLMIAKSASQQAYFNSLIRKYHYQGYRRIVGHCLKYIAYCGSTPIACLGWGSAAWSLDPRDRYIGWDKATKDKNLGFIANNIRFLILPGVKIKYLASHLLSLNAARISDDWKNKYGYRLYLLETFVERARFKGISYRAANWIYLGATKGYSKKGSAHNYHKNIKDIYVYPLCRDFRERMSS